MNNTLKKMLYILYQLGYRYLTKDIENVMEAHIEKPKMDDDGYWISRKKKELPFKKIGDIRKLFGRDEPVSIAQNIDTEKTFNISSKEKHLAIIDLIAPNFRWVARDRTGTLIVAETKPFKKDGSWIWHSEKPIGEMSIFNDMFESIKWEDEKPIGLNKLVQKVRKGEL